MPPDGMYVHAPSGFKFPEAVGTFARVGIDTYDDTGQDTSVGYNNQSYLISATVYVYPAGELTSGGSPPNQAHFNAVKAAIEREHPQATAVVNDQRVTLGSAVGVKATYRLDALFAGARRPLLSETYLFGSGTWFVKYRFTYPEASHEQASAQIREFMDSLRWP